MVDDRGFTEGARKTMYLAREESRRLGHDYVGTEHLLLGLIGGEENTATRVLMSLGVDLDDLKPRGAGLYLIRTLMDDVDYKFYKNKGNVLRMVKRKNR